MWLLYLILLKRFFYRHSLFNYSTGVRIDQVFVAAREEEDARGRQKSTERDKETVGSFSPLRVPAKLWN